MDTRDESERDQRDLASLYMRRERDENDLIPDMDISSSIEEEFNDLRSTSKDSVMKWSLRR